MCCQGFVVELLNWITLILYYLLWGCIIKQNWTDEVEMNSTYNQITNTHISRSNVCCIGKYLTNTYLSHTNNSNNKSIWSNFSKAICFWSALTTFMWTLAMIVVVAVAVCLGMNGHDDDILAQYRMNH